jgi:transcriptional regulator with GAF, ATPase, and Fis domain
MSAVRLELLVGPEPGRVFDSDADSLTLGQAPESDVRLAGPCISDHHARIVLSPSGAYVEDLRSEQGTLLERGGLCLDLGPLSHWRRPLMSGDVLVLGSGGGACRLRVTLAPELEPEHVVSVRLLSEPPQHAGSDRLNTDILRSWHRAQRAIAEAGGLHDVLTAVCDAALSLLANATHVTIVLGEDPGASSEQPQAFTPMLTRVRRADGTFYTPTDGVAVTRSVFRKVIRERAAVLAADAPSEAFSSESLLGASIRSTLAVPLWKAGFIVGVLQVDNRDAPAMFDANDMEALAVLAANASLAVVNGWLIDKLQVAEAALEKENAFLKTRERARAAEGSIIGESPKLRQVLGELRKVADTRVSVLLQGETGTGKELFASLLHYQSRRADKLLVAQNCAALPENLLESELFGHRRGAFTGATEDKRGLFELAHGGTLFLDEVGELPLGLQAKLLRVLQEGEIRPLGGTKTQLVDVRVVTATNRDLQEEVKQGRFREDLYYRLAAFPVLIPPLRERPGDIPLLARHFLGVYTKQLAKPVAGFSQEALELLASYEFPGNVRELQNEVQRVVIQAEPGAVISSDLLSPRVRRLERVVGEAGALPAGSSLRDMLDEVERFLLLRALKEHNNNKTATAKSLGITREGLHKKLRQLNLS